MKDGVDTDEDILLFPIVGYRANWWFVLKEVLMHSGSCMCWGIR